jgi:hypothetical protein
VAAVDLESFLPLPPDPLEPPESFFGDGSFLEDESPEEPDSEPEEPESEPEEPESEVADESVLVVVSLPEESLEALFPFPLRESVL